MEDEVKARSTKLKASIDNLKDCTTQILAQVAALSKVRSTRTSTCKVSRCEVVARWGGSGSLGDGRGGNADGTGCSRSKGGVVLRSKPGAMQTGKNQRLSHPGLWDSRAYTAVVLYVAFCEIRCTWVCALSRSLLPSPYPSPSLSACLISYLSFHLLPLPPCLSHSSTLPYRPRPPPPPTLLLYLIPCFVRASFGTRWSHS